MQKRGSWETKKTKLPHLKDGKRLREDEGLAVAGWIANPIEKESRGRL